MPGNKHLPGVSPKRNRQYSHILAGLKAKHVPIATAKRIAAATTLKSLAAARRKR